LRGKIEVKHVDVLIAGGGPATLGLLCNAMKTDRLKELVMPLSDSSSGLAILERGLSLGGGNL
jgi:ribulose 1,5-bisphosphate synthetase/thiazole synthase